MGEPIEPDSIAAEYASGRMPSLVFAEWGTPELADAYSLTVTTPHTLFILCQTPPPAVSRVIGQRRRYGWTLLKRTDIEDVAIMWFGK